MKTIQEKELKERVWEKLIKKKKYKNYSKTGSFYLIDFKNVFDLILKEGRTQKDNEIKEYWNNLIAQDMEANNIIIAFDNFLSSLDNIEVGK